MMNDIIKYILENSENEVIYEAEFLEEESTIYLNVDCTENIFDIKEIFKGVASQDTLDDNLKLVTTDKEILTNIVEIAGEYFQIVDYMLYATTCSNCEIKHIEKGSIKYATYEPMQILRENINF